MPFAVLASWVCTWISPGPNPTITLSTGCPPFGRLVLLWTEQNPNAVPCSGSGPVNLISPASAAAVRGGVRVWLPRTPPVPISAPLSGARRPSICTSVVAQIAGITRARTLRGACCTSVVAPIAGITGARSLRSATAGRCCRIVSRDHQTAQGTLRDACCRSVVARAYSRPAGRAPGDSGPVGHTPGRRGGPECD
jgi:hypothetical protein